MKAILSKGNSKVHCLNISITPGSKGSCKGISCGDCERACYAKKAYKQYPRVEEAWDNNWEMVQYKKGRVQFFNDIVTRLRGYRGKYFRWHIAGEIVDQDYLARMDMIARIFPKIKFLCFTKNYRLNFKELPKNLKIKFSMFPTTKATSYILQTLPFAWYQDGTETRIPRNAYVCRGSAGKDGVKCARDCNKCWHSDRDVVFNAH